MLLTKSNRLSRIFPAGKTRFVCVNRSAIVANMKENKNYPTILVVEDGKIEEFHSADVEGIMKYEDRTDLPAKVFVETTNEVIAYTDPAGESKFLGSATSNRFVAALKRLNQNKSF